MASRTLSKLRALGAACALITTCALITLSALVVLACASAPRAFAATATPTSLLAPLVPGTSTLGATATISLAADNPLTAASVKGAVADVDVFTTAQAICEQQEAERTALAAAQRTDKVLAYDPALIASIGNQSSGGHTICCPGYACAYGDAVLTGQARDHGYYGCGCCTWPGWGGGNSSFRSLSSDGALLREAYDEIAAGRPTVMHVSGPYGEHWICLIGYRDAVDPDALTLDNFIALDPSNGQEVVASYRYVPYGDACEHVSDLR